jgi:hypothetical protein
MAAKKKEPLINQESRPTAIDYKMPIADFNLGDLQAVIQAQLNEHFKETVKGDHFKEKVEKEVVKGDHLKEKVEKEILKEHLKPEQLKPEYLKPEHLKPEHLKPEGFKPEGFKPEGFKPEGFKPEGGKPIDESTLDRLADKVAERLKK